MEGRVPTLRAALAPAPDPRPVPCGFSITDGSGAVARIARVTAELASAESLADIVTVVADHVSEAVNAAVSTLWLIEGGALVNTGYHGVSREKMNRWMRVPLDDSTPLGEAVLVRGPVVAATAEVVKRDYPEMAPDTPPDRSVVCLPLFAGGDVVGAIGMTFEMNWEPGPSELEFLVTFADACAQTLRRVRATDAARVATQQLQFLASASAELASSLDYRATLAKVAQLAVPDFADWCAVHLLDADGVLVPLALAHADRRKIEWAWQLTHRYPIDMNARTGAANVVRTGVGEVACDITDEMLVATARDEEHLRLARELKIRSALTVPVRARGRVLGTMLLIRTNAKANFDRADLTVAEDLGRRAGLAIDNARLHHDTVALATDLQHALLPDNLASLPDWETCGYYRPDGTAEVGGDFFDAVTIRDGRLAVFIGDVMGHGISAAATMAQMRSSIRALITVDPEPEVVLSRLDALFEDLAVDPLVTIVYALIDSSGEVRLANAGHCPPVVLDSSGAARLIDKRGRPPLGTGATSTPIEQLHLPPGSLLLLYTDGLIERRHESIDLGLQRLCDEAHRLCDGDLTAALGALAEAIAGPNPQDDVAALALRRDLV